MIGKIVLAAAVGALVVAAPGSAGADPTPPPQPGYQIPTPDGPKFPGVQTFPPICGTSPLSCALWYDPATGTWQRKGD